MLGISPSKSNGSRPAVRERVLDAPGQIRNARILKFRIYDIRTGATELGAAEFIDAVRNGRREKIRKARARQAARVEEAEETCRPSTSSRRQEDRWDLGVIEAPRSTNNRGRVG